jgi:nucleoside-diphosphate-sugar epimerase
MCQMHRLLGRSYLYPPLPVLWARVRAISSTRSFLEIPNHPHPCPLPEYRERGKCEEMQQPFSINWQKLHGAAFAGRRVLVTGGAGFIGSHLAEALCALDASVVVIDDLSGGSVSNLDAFGPVEFVKGSILDRDTLARCVPGCEFIFHLAALGSVPQSVAEPRRFYEANVTGTLNVLEAARLAKTVRRVMFAASSSAYGENPVPWIETMPMLACSPYAATKAAGEAMLRAFSRSYQLDTASLRYFNIFGPRQNANSAYAAVIAAFAKALHAGKHPVIHGDGEQSRDFTFVANAVHANLLASRKVEPIGGEVINVGCGQSISVNTLAAQMAGMFDRGDLTPIHESERAGDLKHSFASMTRASAMIGYAPIVDFPTGLDATIRWYRDVL